MPPRRINAVLQLPSSPDPSRLVCRSRSGPSRAGTHPSHHNRGVGIPSVAFQVSTPLRESPPREQICEQRGLKGNKCLTCWLLEDDVFQRCLWAPTALQRTNRDKCAHLLRDHAATADLPSHCALLTATAGFDPQVVVRS